MHVSNLCLLLTANSIFRFIPKPCPPVHVCRTLKLSAQLKWNWNRTETKHRDGRSVLFWLKQNRFENVLFQFRFSFISIARTVQCRRLSHPEDYTRSAKLVLKMRSRAKNRIQKGGRRLRWPRRTGILRNWALGLLKTSARCGHSLIALSTESL